MFKVANSKSKSKVEKKSKLKKNKETKKSKVHDDNNVIINNELNETKKTQESNDLIDPTSHKNNISSQKDDSNLKKRPISDVIDHISSDLLNQESKVQKKHHSRTNIPFKYIDTEIYSEKNPKLQSNRYEDKVLKFSEEQWGVKAARDLQGVSGDRFKHEKTKKKRGSYRGGTISMAVNSVSLASDEEE